MTKKDRLVEIIAFYSNGKNGDFAKRIGVAPSTISSWMTRNTYDHELIFAKCENISAEWLITGEGDMILPARDEESEKERELRDTIRRQQREIDGLYERIEELKRGIVSQASATVV